MAPVGPHYHVGPDLERLLAVAPAPHADGGATLLDELGHRGAHPALEAGKAPAFRASASRKIGWGIQMA